MNELLVNIQDAPKKKVNAIWNRCVGAGRANEGLRAEWQRQLTEVKKTCGVSYLRFHGLLHDDMFVCERENGKLIYHYQYIDSLFDFMIEIGVRPIVEFGFMPTALTSGKDTMFWWEGNICPPDSFEEWGDLIYHLVLHWKERYGLEEIRQWYYEVWNEPNLPVFWAGTKSQYFMLYETAVKAVKSVDELLKVGGPATSNYVPDARFDGEREDESAQLTHKCEDINTLSWHGVWIDQFLEHCHKKNLPVDFVSTHPYPTDFALDADGENSGKTRYVKATRDDLEWVSGHVRNSAYPNAEIHLTEWSSSPSSRDYNHDYLQEAAYIVKNNLDCYELVDSLSYWTFTDVFEEKGGGPADFHGGFGWFNMQGIRKPSFHAYHMLSQLQDYEIARNDNMIVTVSEQGDLAALLYNYPITDGLAISDYPVMSIADETLSRGESIVQKVQVEGLKPGAKVVLETLDEEHGCAMTEWKKLGCPNRMSFEQEKQVREAADNLKVEYAEADENGKLTLECTLTPWMVMMIKTLDRKA